MSAFIHRQTLQHTAMLLVQKHTTGAEKVGGKVIGKLSLPRLDRTALGTSMPMLDPVRMIPSIIVENRSLVLEKRVDRRLFLRDQEHPIVAAGRPATGQFTDFQWQLKRLVIQTRLTNLAT